MRKYLSVILSLLIVTAIFSGCVGDNKTAKDIVIDGLNKGQEINISSFSSKVDIHLDLSNYMQSTDNGLPNLQQLVPQDIQLDINGVEQLKPSRMEATVKTNLMGMDFNIPIIMDQNKVFVKVPSLFKLIIPQLGAKDYLFVDASKAIKNSDSEKLKADQTKTLIKVIEGMDDNLFIKEDPTQYTLDNNTKVKNVVSINVTRENVKPFLQNVVKEGLPIYIAEMEKYAVTKGQKDSIEKLKQDSQNINQAIETLDKSLTINQIKLTSIYDESGIERKAILSLDVIMKDEKNGSIGLKLNVVENRNNINQEINFELPIPTDDQALNVDELQK